MSSLHDSYVDMPDEALVMSHAVFCLAIPAGLGILAFNWIVFFICLALMIILDIILCRNLHYTAFMIIAIISYILVFGDLVLLAATL